MSCNVNKFYNEVPQYNFEIKRGDTWVDPTIQWQDTDGDPIDLSSYTARLTVKDELDGDNTYVELTSGAGEIVLNGAGTGYITFLVSAATTAAWTWEEGEYDLELTLGSVVTTILRGRIRLVGDITV